MSWLTLKFLTKALKLALYILKLLSRLVELPGWVAINAENIVSGIINTISFKVDTPSSTSYLHA